MCKSAGQSQVEYERLHVLSEAREAKVKTQVSVHSIRDEYVCR